MIQQQCGTNVKMKSLQKMSIGAYWTLRSALVANTLYIRLGHHVVRIQSNLKEKYESNANFFVYFIRSFSNSILTVHLSRINGTSHQLKPLYLQPSKSSFCVFSLAFSNCGDQIIGGGSDGCLYIYDLVLAKRTFRCPVIIHFRSFSFIQINNFL